MKEEKVIKSEKSRLILKASPILLLCTLLLVLTFSPAATASGTAPASGQQTAPQAAQPRTITVSGSADVMVIPDQVVITVGVETRSASFATAKSANDQSVKKVMEFAQAHGVESKDIQSDFIETSPQYHYDEGYDNTKVKYYNVRKRLVIKLRDISRFESLTSDLMYDGTIQIQNIDFKSTDLYKQKNEARKLAIKAAKEKAQLLTGELGASVSRPLSINEEYVNNTTWYGSGWWSSWYDRGQSQLTSNMMTNAAPGTPQGQAETGETVSIGQIKVTAAVNVCFEIY